MLIERNTLSSALNNAARIAQSRATLAVLANVRITCHGLADVLIIRTTDLERGLEQHIPTASGDDEFDTTVNARMIAETVNAMTGAEVELTIERGKLIVKSDKAVTELLTIPASEFPPFAPMPNSEPIDAAAFVEAASRVMVAASTDAARPVLQGVNCDGFKMVATDGFRIHVAPFEIPGKAIIPARTMAEAVKLFWKAETLMVASSGAQWFVSDGDKTLITQVIEGNFPDWKAIIPKEQKTTIAFDVAALSASLRRVLLMSSNNVVKFEAGTDGLLLSCHADEIGRAEDVVSATITGDPLPAFAMNGKFTLDALAAVRTNPVKMHVNHPTLPIVIEDGTKWQAVVMPMHLEGE